MSSDADRAIVRAWPTKYELYTHYEVLCRGPSSKKMERPRNRIQEYCHPKWQCSHAERPYVRRHSILCSISSLIVRTLTMRTMTMGNLQRNLHVGALLLVLHHSLVADAFVVHHPAAAEFRLARAPRQTSFSVTTTAQWLSPLSYEALVEKLPSQSVIEVVEKAPDGKVVAADVAAAAGVSLSQAQKDLTALASISQGDIAVSKDGELIYEFPPNVKSVLSSKSLKYKTQQAFLKIWPGLFYVLRVSFGVGLLASLAAIYSTIFFLSSQSSSSDDDNDQRRGNRGSMSLGGPSYFWGPSPWDFFYYRPYYGYYGGGDAPFGRPARDPDEMGFLESVFSYIFGDGNPNEGLEERRLSIAANMIRENKGSVTAEQLAPFCDEAPPPKISDDASSAYVDEVSC